MEFWVNQTDVSHRGGVTENRDSQEKKTVLAMNFDDFRPALFSCEGTRRHTGNVFALFSFSVRSTKRDETS